MEIRAGRIGADVSACVALWLIAVEARDGGIPDPPALTERMTRKFDQPVLRFAVVDGESPGSITGFALTVRRPQPDGGDLAFLEMLAVAPEQAGRGLGRVLLADGVAAAERLGHPGMDLQVRDGNAAAIALYRSAGFVRVGVPEPHAHGGAPMITMTTRRQI